MHNRHQTGQVCISKIRNVYICSQGNKARHFTESIKNHQQKKQFRIVDKSPYESGMFTSQSIFKL